MEIGELVRGVLVPTCVVITTPGAEAVCGRNGRRVVEVLRSQNTTRTLAARGPNDRTYAVRDFQLRFADLQDFARPPSTSGAATPRGGAAEENGSPAPALNRDAEALHRLLVSSADDAYSPPLSLKDPADVASFLRASKGQDVTPWYTQYRWAYMRSIGPAPYEHFDMPVACLFVSSTGEENVTKSFLDLYKPPDLPPIFKDGFMDPNIAKFHLLLHDNAADPAPNAEQAMNEIRATFGKDCALLKLNSLPPDQAGVGWFLSGEDVRNIQETIANLSAKTVAQHMQGVIARLHEQVMANRKGFVTAMALGASSFMGLKFGRAKAAKPAPTPSGRPDGRTHEITRLLADLEFMIGMYDLALANYKQLAGEFKSEKDCGPEYYAAAQEMMGLATLMSDPTPRGPRRDVEQYLETAADGYRRAENWTHAVRASVFLAELLSATSPRLAAFTLQRMALALPDRLCAALLHEQSAFQFLHHQASPNQRQFGLELVAAGSLFCEVGQLRHGLRCLLTAYSLYENRGWGGIGDSLHVKLARNLFLVGDHERCLDFFQKLFSDCHQPPPVQNALLREFLHVAAQIAVQPLVQAQQLQAPHQQALDLVTSRLPVPVIDQQSVRLYLASYNPASGSSDERQWTSLQSRVLTEVAAPRSSLPSSRPVSVIQEYIYIEVEVRNPLQVPIQLTDVQLVCAHVPPEGTVDKIGATDAQETEEPFLVEPFNYVLRAQEKQKLLFWVVPLVEGQLVISGIGFKLCGVLWGQSDFIDLHKCFVGGTGAAGGGLKYSSPSAPPALTSSDATTNKTNSCSNNAIHVVGAMPLLEASFEHFPEHMLQGEVVLLTLHLRNIGHTGMGEITVGVSHPHFFVIGEARDGGAKANPDDHDDDEGDAAAAVALHRSGHAGPQPGPLIGTWSSSSFFEEPPGSVVKLAGLKALGPGEAVSLPVWIRAATAGHTHFRFLFYYRPHHDDADTNVSTALMATPTPGMAYRLHRLAQSVRVRPSIGASTWLRVSTVDLASQVLALTIANSHDHTAFRLRQVSAISRKWALLPLHAHTSDPAGSLDSRVGSADDDATSAASADPMAVSPSGKPLRRRRRSGSSTRESYRVEPGQTKTFFLRVVPRDDHASNGARRVGTHLTLDGAAEAFNHADRPYASFLRVERQRHMAGLVPLGFMNLDPVTGEPVPPPPPALDLLVFWRTRTSSGVHQGLQYLPCSPVALPAVAAPPRPLALSDSSSRGVDGTSGSGSSSGPGLTDQPLRFMVVAPRQVVHEFEGGAPCVVSAAIQLKNTSGVVLNVRLELLRPNQPRRASAYPGVRATPPSLSSSSSSLPPTSSSTGGGAATGRPRSASMSRQLQLTAMMEMAREAQPQHYVWCGPTVQHANGLAAGADVTFNVTPCFMSPGVYSLEHFQLVVHTPGQQQQPQVISPLQHLVFVSSPSSSAQV